MQSQPRTALVGKLSRPQIWFAPAHDNAADRMRARNRAPRCDVTSRSWRHSCHCHAEYGRVYVFLMQNVFTGRSAAARRKTSSSQQQHTR